MKQIIVNVAGLTNEEKQRVGEALAKIKNIRKCSPPHMDDVITMYGSSFDGVNVDFDYHKGANPTHTTQQVLEMAGMTTKRKVRKDFDPTKEYSVDVSGCTEERKKEVQQAFFDVGIEWRCGGAEYCYPSALQYTNKYDVGDVSAHKLHVGTSNGSNMSAQEFLNLVYEPEQQGHVHAELMAQYAEDAKTHTEPWKLWQSKGDDGVWRYCCVHPMWASDTEYRCKPKTHTVNGVEVPDLRIKPKFGQEYWYPDASIDALVWGTVHGYEQSIDNHRIANNLYYEPTEAGRQAAILHAKAWLSIA